MAQAFKLQDPGEGIHEVEIREILVAEGDTVEEGENVFVVESDKAAVEVPAPFSGTVDEIRVEEGGVAEVGDVLMTIETSDQDRVESSSGNPDNEIEETAEQDQQAEAESDANGGSNESDEGKEGSDAAEQGDRAEPEDAAADLPDDGPKTPARSTRSDEEDIDIKASPAARRRAEKLGLRLADIKGTGTQGHITKADVVRASDRGKAGGDAGTNNKDKTGGTAADPQRFGPVDRMPLKSIRRVTARRMAQAWAEIPHVTHQDNVDATELEELRQFLVADFGENAPKLTFTAFVLKALGIVLQSHPSFNAMLDMDAQEIVLKKYYHIALALDSDRGLLTPVIRDVDTKSVLDLAEAAEQLGEEIRDGHAKKADLAGGSFTLTNIGSLGGTAFNPIINYPQVAILGTARARWEQVVMGDQRNPNLQVRLMLPLVLTFDHRVGDGADAARFMNDLKELLASPTRLLAEQH